MNIKSSTFPGKRDKPCWIPFTQEYLWAHGIKMEVGTDCDIPHAPPVDSGTLERDTKYRFDSEIVKRSKDQLDSSGVRNFRELGGLIAEYAAPVTLARQFEMGTRLFSTLTLEVGTAVLTKFYHVAFERAVVLEGRIVPPRDGLDIEVYDPAGQLSEDPWRNPYRAAAPLGSGATYLISRTSQGTQTRVVLPPSHPLSIVAPTAQQAESSMSPSTFQLADPGLPDKIRPGDMVLVGERTLRFLGRLGSSPRHLLLVDERQGEVDVQIIREGKNALASSSAGSALRAVMPTKQSFLIETEPELAEHFFGNGRLYTLEFAG
jgi:hypothetical protein